MVAPVGIEPTITHSRRASLLYTNLWKSRSVLHKAI